MPDNQHRNQPRSQSEIESEWVDKLVGHTILNIRYMSEEEASAMGWDRRPLVLELSNSHVVFAASDDEGNDAGALFGMNPFVVGSDWRAPVMR